jgi:hypothetical protein
MRLFAVDEGVAVGRLVVAGLEVATLAVEQDRLAVALAEDAMRPAAPWATLMLLDVIALGVSKPNVGSASGHGDFSKNTDAAGTDSD